MLHERKFLQSPEANSPMIGRTRSHEADGGLAPPRIAAFTGFSDLPRHEDVSIEKETSRTMPFPPALDNPPPADPRAIDLVAHAARSSAADIDRLPHPISNVAVQYQRTREMTIDELLLENRVVFLIGEINHASAARVMMQMLYLENQKRGQDINFYINSPGGAVDDTLALYDTMRFLSSHVATYCIGRAYSGGAVLLTAGASRPSRSSSPRRNSSGSSRATPGRTRRRFARIPSATATSRRRKPRTTASSTRCSPSPAPARRPDESPPA